VVAYIWPRKTTRPVRTADDPDGIRYKYPPNKSHRMLRLNQQHACAGDDDDMMLMVILTESELYVFFSSYRAVNTLRLGYKNQSVNAV
jgi:hypothetical protein